MISNYLTTLILTVIIPNSLQVCSSTQSITTCPWTALQSRAPLQIQDYKKFLSFTKGNLEQIPDGAFKFLPYITALQLSGNKITELEREDFEGLVNLKQLNLYDNRLREVSKDALKHCQGLIKLDLGMNQIGSVHEKAFEQLVALEELNLGFNKLTSVPKAVNDLAALKKLRLDNNAIERIPPNSFLKLAKLEELQLNDNKLIKIEVDSFKGLNNLKTLDLRVNFLSSVNVENLVGCARNLIKIGLSVNSFKCSELKKVLEGLQRSNVEVIRGVSNKPSSIHGISCN